MWPLVLLVVGISMTVSYSVMHTRALTEQQVVVRGDVSATNFLSYRSALVRYRNANPGATGTISDASLTWDAGYIRDSRWSNLITGGELYVYTTGSIDPAMLNMLYEKTGRYILLGTKNASGNLVSPGGSVITTTLPAGIPVGAIVFMGG